MPPKKGDRLGTYRAMRDAERTPEPFGASTGTSESSSTSTSATSREITAPDVPEPGHGGLFVVQRHSARHDHYDFRLEMNGVLASWAVPRGPATDPAIKRLAIQTEDHPLEYGGFEGLIPDGNYGAGAVIIWDRGAWVRLEDPHPGDEKILFELKGYKLRGVWQLIKTKRKNAPNPREWLLIKKPDAWSTKEGDPPPPDVSVLSGLTVEELKAGRGTKKAAEIRERLEQLRAPRKRVTGAEGFMLAETADGPFSGPEWLFELKYDGFRMLVVKDGARTSLTYRRGKEVSHVYPDLARALAALPFERLVIDGEVVVLDDRAHPRFDALQRRANLSRQADIDRASVELPATLYAFDLLGFEDFDLRPLPLHERKALLRKILPLGGPLRFSDHVEGKGKELFQQVVGLGLEGVMAKRKDSPYRPGRSPAWLKVKGGRNADCAVVGFDAPAGNRVGFGALHIAMKGAEGLVYVGKVGSGFSGAQLEQLHARLSAKRCDAPACAGEIIRERGDVWVEPEVVVEVHYMDWTDAGRLRHPVFQRVRDDKTVADVSPARGVTAPIEQPIEEQPIEEQPTEEQPIDKREINLTNLDKVFFPEHGYTKGDLIAYYRAVAPWLLPYLKDRPVVLTRFPDGIHGKSFFQKDAPGFAADRVRTIRLSSESVGRDINYFVADELDALVYLANMGTIPLHVWSSRVAALSTPDWCILDLDPKGAPFADVVTLALAIRDLTREIGLPSYPKVSGSTGLHVLIPLACRFTYEQSRQLAELLARVIVEDHPKIATVERVVEARGGKVYVDFGQNGHGRLLVSPFSVRPLPGAPVSMTLRWDEVGPGLDPQAYTIRTAIPRLSSEGDPMLPVLSEVPDLPKALANLARRLKR